MPSFVLRTVSTESTRNLNLHAITAPAECCGCPLESRCAAYCRDNYGSLGGYCEGFLDLRCVCI